MRDPALLEEKFESDIVREVENYFSGRADGFLVKTSTIVPYTMLDVEFVLYNYFVVCLSVEHRTVCFGIREEKLCLRLFNTTLLSAPESSGAEKIGSSALKKLDQEVRLRIPDKYLVAKGW